MCVCVREKERERGRERERDRDQVDLHPPRGRRRRIEDIPIAIICTFPPRQRRGQGGPTDFLPNHPPRETLVRFEFESGCRSICFALLKTHLPPPLIDRRHVLPPHEVLTRTYRRRRQINGKRKHDLGVRKKGLMNWGGSMGTYWSQARFIIDVPWLLTTSYGIAL